MGKTERLIVGCMSGTSCDGVDAALVRIAGKGKGMEWRCLATHSAPMGALRDRLRRMCQQEAFPASEFVRVREELTRIHVEAIRAVTPEHRPHLVAVHGQTIFHQPPHSWQLINPTPIALQVGCPVVSDLRAADLAAGGQGAPITPLADWLLFRAFGENRAVINLGGFANLTFLPESDHAGQVQGEDVCVCNQLLDRLAIQLLHQDYDDEGRIACQGAVVAALRERLLETFRLQAEADRSLGTGDESLDWITEYYEENPPDVLATACAAIAETLFARLDVHLKGDRLDHVILAGGGAANRAIQRAIRRLASGTPVSLCDSLGVPTTHREAVAMAVLGALCADRQPITLKAVTGAAEPPVAGLWARP